MKKKALILLSGCGSLDGSDPFETVFLATALEKAGVEVIYAAPDCFQTMTASHLTGEKQGRGRRKILDESARLTRGKLFPLMDISPKLPQGVFIPGGQGTLKNLFKKFGTKRSSPRREVVRFLREAHNNRAVIVSFSLAVSIMSAAFPEHGLGEIDLLGLKPGKYLANEALRFIVAPGAIASHSLLPLEQEISNVVKEFCALAECG